MASTHRRLQTAIELLERAGCANEGETLRVDARSYRRVPLDRRAVKRFGVLPIMVKQLDAPSARALNCGKEEDDAFWCWAVAEVLRLTGLRCEELLELTHLSIRQYRPPDGQVVLLLQIAPSKLDRERVIPVCPELAHALAMIVARVRGSSTAVPLAQRWDPHEQVLSPPMPFLFQRRQNGSQVTMGWSSIVGLLDRAARHAGLCDVDGQPLVFRPHDLRRIFATDDVNGGLPVHIAAKLLGHLDLNTTQGYVAVYDEQVIRHVQAYVARRRAVCPSDEYREPTSAEWAEFEQHFRRRKMALGDCYRPYGTDCPHEHACIRCPMLRMDRNQLPRLVLIEQDTHRLLDEARLKGWEGEVLGLETTLCPHRR